MLRILSALLATLTLLGCATSAPYGWQDTRTPPRDDASSDLAACQSFAARQYRPGMPWGSSFLEKDPAQQPTTEDQQRQWRPDRSPFPVVNINSQATHDVPVDYSGYPGELDYHPGYLDEILEKCMHDRNWEYRPISNRDKK